MANIKQERATANLRMLEFVARKLGPLNEEVIYLGGCTTALFITDPLSLDVRPTKDVDCIIDIVVIIFSRDTTDKYLVRPSWDKLNF